jgi:MFS transporter, DHA3 family, macrolide efflux protein
MKTDFKSRTDGMKIFTLIWFGQLISIMGTSMTKFAMIIWAYEQVGRATTTALLGFFSILPYVLLSPLAGALVDKYDRKRIMILSDLGSGTVTVMMLILYSLNSLEVWHLFVFEALLGSLEAFQVPAYTAAITMLIPKNKYSRASGMRSFSSWASQILAPILGGFLMIKIGVRGVFLIDITTFIFAVSTIFIVNIPHPEVELGRNESLRSNMVFGMKYLLKHRGLLWLMLMFAIINLLAGMAYYGILPAMILARSHNNKMVLAGVQAALGLGGVIGSLMVSLLGCPKNKIMTMVVTGVGTFILGDFLIGLGTSPYTWNIAAFLSSIFLPFMIAAQNTLWQSKVEPSIQGRVFAAKGMLQLNAMPVGYLLGGFLADYVLEPAMTRGGFIADSFGWMVGTAQGSGMSLIFLFTGILGTLVSLSGYFIKELRNLDAYMPDHDAKIVSR